MLQAIASSAAWHIQLHPTEKLCSLIKLCTASLCSLIFHVGICFNTHTYTYTQYLFILASGMVKVRIPTWTTFWNRYALISTCPTRFSFRYNALIPKNRQTNTIGNQCYSLSWVPGEVYIDSYVCSIVRYCLTGRQTCAYPPKHTLCVLLVNPNARTHLYWV